MNMIHENTNWRTLKNEELDITSGGLKIWHIAPGAVGMDTDDGRHIEIYKSGASLNGRIVPSNVIKLILDYPPPGSGNSFATLQLQGGVIRRYNNGDEYNNGDSEWENMYQSWAIATD